MEMTQNCSSYMEWLSLEEAGKTMAWKTLPSQWKPLEGARRHMIWNHSPIIKLKLKVLIPPLKQMLFNQSLSQATLAMPQILNSYQRRTKTWPKLLLKSLNQMQIWSFNMFHNMMNKNENERHKLDCKIDKYMVCPDWHEQRETRNAKNWWIFDSFFINENEMTLKLKQTLTRS